MHNQKMAHYGRYWEGIVNFMCTYAKSNRAKCTACKNNINKNHLKIGTCGIACDHWNDSLWFHYRCFWTKCAYRKKAAYLDSEESFGGFDEIKDADKERIKKSLIKLKEHFKQKEESANATSGPASGDGTADEASTSGDAKSSTSANAEEETKVKSKCDEEKVAESEKGEECPSDSKSSATEIKSEYHICNAGRSISICITKQNGDLTINLIRKSGADINPESSLTLPIWKHLSSKPITDSIDDAIRDLEAKKDKLEDDEPAKKKRKRSSAKSSAKESVPTDERREISLSSTERSVNVVIKPDDGTPHVFVQLPVSTSGTEGNFELIVDEWRSVKEIASSINKDIHTKFGVTHDNTASL